MSAIVLGEARQFVASASAPGDERERSPLCLLPRAKGEVTEHLALNLRQSFDDLTVELTTLDGGRRMAVDENSCVHGAGHSMLVREMASRAVAGDGVAPSARGLVGSPLWWFRVRLWGL